jgi:hypothetical protein
MRLLRVRFTVRAMMVMVAVVAAGLPIAREAGRIWVSLPWRPWNSLLRVGQPVITVGAARAVSPDGPGPLASGTRCVVVRESAWDDDSRYEGRKIVVRVLGGTRAGEVKEVLRDQLRPL